MLNALSGPVTAFDGVKRLARGALVDVALAVKAALSATPDASVLVFDDSTGAVIDLDLRGAPAEIVERLAAQHGERQPSLSEPHSIDEKEDQAATRGRGRPRLGVIGREVTLLPRHWQWLAQQRGGASQALRRLIDEARRADGDRTRTRANQDRAYRFMSAMAGDLAGFEEASRALFSGNRAAFDRCTQTWPLDVRVHAHELAWTSTETAPADDANA